MEENGLPTSVCIFEDGRYPNFFPLTLNRPVFDLFLGTQTLKEKIVADLNPEKLILLCRPYLAPVVSAQEGAGEEESSVRVNEGKEDGAGETGELLFINGRLLVYESDFGNLLDELEENCVIQKNGTPVAAH